MDTQKTLRRLLRTQFLALSLSTLAAAPSLVCAEDDITGDWEVKMDRNGRQSFAALSITKKADGTFTGKWGATELSDVKVDGRKLTFVRTVRFGDRELKMTYEGTLNDGGLMGTMTSERGSFAANAVRRKPRNPALGRWEFKYAVAGRDINATLAVSEGAGGALDGKWTSNVGEHVVSNIKFQEGKLTFSRKSKFGDRELESSYEGTIQGNKLSGAIKSELGEIQANGQRVGAELIGKWDLTTTSERGPRTGMLTVFGDLTGRYELFGGEIPIKDLKLEGGQVTFSVEAGFGDQQFTMDFKGKIDKNTLKGELTTPRGTREVTGKKADSVSALVGTWEITREGSRGSRTVKLTIKDDGTGTFTDGDSTVGITDLHLDEDQISFKATVKREDRDVPMEFKGKVEGMALKGQFITPRGAREATGKKVVGTRL